MVNVIMNKFRIRRLPKSVACAAALIALLATAGCWDKTEMSDLAIVSLAGADFDPESQKNIIYYQIVNPSGVAKRRESGPATPFYTFKLEGNEKIGELFTDTTEYIPRKLFTAHYKALIISERLAKRGILESIHWIESLTDRRSSVPVLVSEDPLDQVMNAFTPLERLPGEAIESELFITRNISSAFGRMIRMNNIVKRMDSKRATVVPIVSFVGDPQKAAMMDRLDSVRGNTETIKFDGGAIFVRDRMVGRLNKEETRWYNFLTGQTRVLLLTLPEPPNPIVETVQAKVTRKWTWNEGEPELNIVVRAKLSLRRNTSFIPMSGQTLKKIENQFNKHAKTETMRLIEKWRDKGIDLFGIDEELKAQEGRKWRPYRENDEAWKRIRIRVTVQSQFRQLGNMIRYIEGGTL